MTITEVTSKRSKTADDGDETARRPTPESHAGSRHRMKMAPFLLTLAAVTVAGPS